MFKAYTVTGIILLLVLTVTPMVFCQPQTATVEEWQVISNNGYYNQTDGAMHLWSNGSPEYPPRHITRETHQPHRRLQLPNPSLR